MFYMPPPGKRPRAEPAEERPAEPVGEQQATITSTAPRPTLPVWPTVRDAFASVLANWLAVLRIFWAWGVILFVLHVSNSVALLFTAGAPSANIVVGFLLYIIVYVLAFASTAVAWHRLMLLGERPPAMNLRIGGRVPRYIGRVLLIGLIAMLIFTACALLFLFSPARELVARSPGVPPSAGSLLLSQAIAHLVGLPAMIATIRLSVSLPGVAVGRTITLGDTWRLTTGNALRLGGGTLLLYLPSYMIGIGIGLLPVSGRVSLPMLLLLFGVGALSTVAAISFLSLSYRLLTGTAQSAQPQSV